MARHPRETLHRQVSVTPDDDVVAPHDNKDMTRNQSCGALALHHPSAYHLSTIFAFIGLVAEVVNRGGYNNGSVFYDHSTLTSELTDIALLILILTIHKKYNAIDERGSNCAHHAQGTRAVEASTSRVPPPPPSRIQRRHRYGSMLDGGQTRALSHSF